MENLVYKYLPPDRLDVVESLLIRITQPISLNDPFEYHNLFDFDEFENASLSKNEVTRYANQLVTSELHNSINKSINDNFGIISFSNNELNSLMWAHYARQNTGYVIGFDTSNTTFTTKVKTLTKNFNSVIYSEKRPKFKIEALRVDQTFLCRKPIDWFYEEEVRFIDTFDSELVQLEKRDEFDQIVYLRRLSKDVVKEIVIGNRMNQENMQKILGSIQKNGILCDLYMLELDKSSYRLHKAKIS